MEAAGESEPSDDLLCRGESISRNPGSSFRADRSATSAAIAPSLNRQHAVERDLRPVLLVIWNDDAVMDFAVEQSFEGPEQMIRRHAEHRRAKAAELIERQDGAIRLH